MPAPEGRRIMRKLFLGPGARFVCWYLVVFLSGILVVPETAKAAFISPSKDALKGMDADTLGSVRLALENDLLAERLAQLGLSPEEIKERLDTLSPGEHEAVMSDFERIQAGGNGIGSLVSLAVLILLIVLIIKLLDKEIIIK